MQTRPPKSIKSVNDVNVVVGDYEIHLARNIGGGQQGKIFDCTQISTQRQICVKIVERKRFNEKQLEQEVEICREIQGQNGISDSNLVRIYDIMNYDECNEVYFFVEKCDGDLQRLMIERQNQKQWFTMPEIIEIVTQIAKGYRALQHKKIIHRDLKPDNILIKRQMLNNKEKVYYKICDYGVSKLLDQGHQAISRAGAPFYQAPEILLQSQNNPIPYTDKCDIYSLGVMLYILCYQTRHIDIQTADQLKSFVLSLKIKDFKCPEDRNVPPEMRYLIEQMIVYDANKRLNWIDLQTNNWFQTITKRYEENKPKIVIKMVNKQQVLHPYLVYNWKLTQKVKESLIKLDLQTQKVLFILTVYQDLLVKLLLQIQHIEKDTFLLQHKVDLKSKEEEKQAIYNQLDPKEQQSLSQLRTIKPSIESIQQITQLFRDYYLQNIKQIVYSQISNNNGCPTQNQFWILKLAYLDIECPIADADKFAEKDIVPIMFIPTSEISKNYFRSHMDD